MLANGDRSSNAWVVVLISTMITRYVGSYQMNGNPIFLLAAYTNVQTMDTPFMESCWWVFKELWDKNKVYRAYQIMPFLTALCTPLSQMEAKQNEKMTQDPAILIAFPVLDQPGYENTSLVIYTTTPWTLPSNLLIAVHPEFEYIRILDEKSGRYYILLESGLSSLYKDLKKAKYKVSSKIPGKEMIGWKYTPLFPTSPSSSPTVSRLSVQTMLRLARVQGSSTRHQGLVRRITTLPLPQALSRLNVFPPALSTIRNSSLRKFPNMLANM